MQSSGDIRGAIARHPTERKRMAVVADHAGRDAHTSYRVLEKLNEATLVEAQIHTGRTHQVRVHLQSIGIPVVGDTTYGPKPNKKLTEVTGYTAPRVMLHARELTFVHPRTKREMHFAAPLPKDFKEALKVLRG
jgi:23S rRNA pseudouridine1911/1915/1917 synthase